MATIVITFDTKEKTLAVTMDGKAVDNVAGAYVGQPYGYDADEDDFRCELMMAADNDDEGYQTMTRIVASDSTEGKKLGEAAPESKEVPGFKVAEVNTDQFETDVAAYIKKAREPKRAAK